MRWLLNVGSIVFYLMAIQVSAQDAIHWVQSSNYSDKHLIEELSRKLDEPAPIKGKDKPVPLSAVTSMYPLAVLIDERALEEESITLDEPISFPNVPGISIRNQLKIILEPLQLTYVENPGYLLITSKKSSANVLRLYDVTSLVGQIKGEYNFASLMNIIERSISDHGWASGGGNSSMTEWRTPTAAILVVNAPNETHEAIRDLFSAKQELLTRADPSGSSRRLPSTKFRKGSVRRSSLRGKAD